MFDDDDDPFDEPFELLVDPFLQAEIERALAPFRELLPRVARGTFREMPPEQQVGSQQLAFQQLGFLRFTGVVALERGQAGGCSCCGSAAGDADPGEGAELPWPCGWA